jgi:hypothetical protein
LTGEYRLTNEEFSVEEEEKEEEKTDKEEKEAKEDNFKEGEKEEEKQKETKKKKKTTVTYANKCEYIGFGPGMRANPENRREGRHADRPGRGRKPKNQEPDNQGPNQAPSTAAKPVYMNLFGGAEPVIEELSSGSLTVKNCYTLARHIIKQKDTDPNTVALHLVQYEI